jgi:hypothetical protein
MYGPFAPLLRFSGDAAEQRGAEIVPVSWSSPDDPPTLPEQERGPWVMAEVKPYLDGIEPSLLIGKSLGTYAAALAADRAVPAVWLTPVLTSAWVVDALRRSTAPYLLVGGDADQLWDSALARELSPHVLEVPGADHGMYVPGPLAESTAVLGEVVTAVERFLDEVVWP